jgi:hypothetical protein
LRGMVGWWEGVKPVDHLLCIFGLKVRLILLFVLCGWRS